ncbi:DUF805 domain-containing protein [Ponticaulis sp.]|uniref:DUF805 domain-containing protein n=1 Tax=Ponticaulis sp. TaxID=2020902 RepID=UPI000C660F85|nr:DUF805 domain-containing protein [Ponticaulis sp.]MBN03721.1 hypothetical protein [Ponticaulis sp.]|tara:strand:+ start:550 stop:954 length:405 start_codon:yes stop_codon:yes gene_type:complete
MDFGTAVGRYFSNYFNFQDRARRAEYWWPVFMQLIAYLAMLALSSLFAMLGDIGVMLIWIPIVLYWLFGLACFIPSLAVAVRRLHDKDMSGWWILIGLVPLIGALLLLFFFVTEGTPGPNKYGPNPKSPTPDVF